MSKDNPIAVAVELAEGKYKDNKGIQALYVSFKHSRMIVNLTIMHQEKFPKNALWKGYLKGLEGEEGYFATYISADTIKSAMEEQLKIVREMVEASSKAQCLIETLQGMGESIDY